MKSAKELHAEHGVTAVLRYFGKKYLEMPLKETSIRCYVVNIFTRTWNWEIRQIFFRQMCFCGEFAKFSHRQSFPPYGTSVPYITSLFIT